MAKAMNRKVSSNKKTNSRRNVRNNNVSKKKKKNHFLRDTFIFLFPICLFLCGFYIYDHYVNQATEIPSVNELIEEKKKIGYQDKDDHKIDVEQYVNHLPEYRSEYGNDSIMGKLEIPNLNIDTLVTRTGNNEYYLYYNIYGQWDGLGVPFFDYRNQDLSHNRQVNIYGHNTQRAEYYSQLPFMNLEAYVDKNMFDNYKDIYLSIDERQVHYEVVAIKILTDGNNEHMKLNFSSDADFLQHINRLFSGSLYMSDNASFTAQDRLLVLQVCHYNPMGSYLLVFGKEVK